MDVELVLSVLRALGSHGVRYAIVGGVALNVHGLVRATVDIDVFVDPSEENIARLRAALRSVFDDPNIDEINAADLNGAYPAIQYVPPRGAFHIDILARLGQAYSFADIETEKRQVEGIVVEVATPQMLYRMKRDTVRMQDRVDAARLREHFGLDDEDGGR